MDRFSGILTNIVGTLFHATFELSYHPYDNKETGAERLTHLTMVTKRKTEDDADDTETDEEEIKETIEGNDDDDDDDDDDGVDVPVSEEKGKSSRKKARTDNTVTERYQKDEKPLELVEIDSTATEKKESPRNVDQSHKQGDNEAVDADDTENASTMKLQNVDNESAEEGITNQGDNDEINCNQGELEEKEEKKDDDTQPPVQPSDIEAIVHEEGNHDVSVDIDTQSPAQVSNTGAIENKGGIDDLNIDIKVVETKVNDKEKTDKDKEGEGEQEFDIKCENKRGINDKEVSEKEKIYKKGEETEKENGDKVGNNSVGDKNDEDTNAENECENEIKECNNGRDGKETKGKIASEKKTHDEEKEIFEREKKDDGSIEVSDSEDDDEEESDQRSNDGQAKDSNSKTDEKKESPIQVDIAPRPEGNIVKEAPLLSTNGLYGGTSAGNEDAPVVRTTLGRRLTFPEKLMELLNSEETQNSMCWIQAGNACALHQTLFVKNILPVHFEGTKFESFTRKLNRWGFKRIAGEGIPENAFAYSHHLFKRDYPELCRGMSGGKKVEQDFSHLIRYRELARRFPDGQASMPSAMSGGGMSAAMNGSLGSGMVAGMGVGIGTGMGVGTGIGLGGGMGGGMNGGMGGVMGGGMGNGMTGAMGGLGSRYPGSHSGDTLQSLEVENLLLERQINMGGTGGGSGAGLGAEHDLVFRKALLRQEAAVVREQRLEQQLMMERMLREHQGSSVGGPGGYMGGGGHNSGDNADGDHRRAAFLAREQAQIAALNAGSGADRMFHRDGSLGGGGSCGSSRSGSDIERQQLHMFAERQAMQDRQALQERMAYFGNGPGQSSYMGNSAGGMFTSQGSERSMSEQMHRDEEETATRMRIERRLMQEVAMREQQGLSSMGGAGVGRYNGGM